MKGHYFWFYHDRWYARTHTFIGFSAQSSTFGCFAMVLFHSRCLYYNLLFSLSIFFPFSSGFLSLVPSILPNNTVKVIKSTLLFAFNVFESNVKVGAWKRSSDTQVCCRVLYMFVMLSVCIFFFFFQLCRCSSEKGD